MSCRSFGFTIRLCLLSAASINVAFEAQFGSY